MAFTRLYWIPPGLPPREGAYVRYPLGELLGILALESQRHRCLVIGEDLGTVSDEVRHALGAGRVLGLYEEQFYLDGSPLPAVGVAAAMPSSCRTSGGRRTSRSRASTARNAGSSSSSA